MMETRRGAAQSALRRRLRLNPLHRTPTAPRGLQVRYSSRAVGAGERQSASRLMIRAIDHVQLSMPRGREDDARAFYRDVLGMIEQPKPENLARRGGAWFAAGDARVHLGVEDDFRPAKKAHPALLVADLKALLERCRAAGYGVNTDETLPGYDRAYVSDPFGNRIELLEPMAGC
jgi:catechol 2,3-dioxygenase-like lactoylglutathione lyase family enzyme